ncbi:MAG: pyridoxamine 5'-phosphate oxidase family protein [Phycicoccus sp.]|nr:pyridoxamine 5'-phosphate oxidase family protein [Phycicoccus sp.]
MSIPVDVAELERTLGDFGAGYLLTASPEGQVKAVTVEPVVTGGTLVVPRSRGSAANLASNPRVTVIFPPRVARGYTLIIDGSATVGDDEIVVTAATAVLHRPASHSESPSAPEGCGHDCAPI